MKPAFVHLHLHTEYSLVDGTVRIKPLVDAVAEQGMPAVAVTDQCNLFAMVKFYRAAMARGVKPVIGVDLWMINHADDKQAGRIVLLCKDQQGYLNLTRLVSRTYTDGQHRGIPMLDFDWLEGMTNGLIALSGGKSGDIGQMLQAGKTEEARKRLETWCALFPDSYYLELQRTGQAGEDEYLHAAVDLAMHCDVPVVATNPVHFLTPDGFDAHEARVCINEGRTLDDPRRHRRYTDQQYLRSQEEMQALFEDIPEALENTVEIARRCNLELSLGSNYLPDFPVPGEISIADYLRKLSREGLQRRLDSLPYVREDSSLRPLYEQRLETELDVIISMGFPGYFLIVSDFIKWAKENDIPVGPGRGSGAGSLVAYALMITDLDPLRYELLFERFLNPERVSMPDFDIDFCMEGRDRVIEYVAERYGREKVSQIITYGSMAAKAVVRDVGRVLGHPYGFVDRIAKLIPFEIGITLDRALEQEPPLRELYEQDEEVHAVIDLARNLEGLARNAGKHAGGVVIAPSRLTDFTPLYCEQGSTSIVSQFDKDDVEAVGLVKFDFLGLRTLTIIDRAVKTVNAQHAQTGGEEPVCIDTIPLDDKKTFDLLKACTTTAVFQLESSGMKDLIRRLQPDSFEDIVALVALFRPGPLQSGMVDDFIQRKHGLARVEYPHLALEPILKPTYGVILYQEQVMQIAQVLAGYTLGGADLLRRAMGKKKPAEMAKQRAIFMEGTGKLSVDQETATHIFDLMEKFAGYGFNKSHSAAYALLSYQTAWLKAHYPAAFMAAVLSADMDNTDKIVRLIDECRDIGLKLVPPDINISLFPFTVRGDNTVVYGLGAIKGVGQAAIEGMIEERNTGGPFEDIYELCRRVDLRKFNRRVLEAMIRAGVLDSVGENRASEMARLPTAIKLAEQQSRDHATGQVDLFGAAAKSVDSPASEPCLPEWDEEQRLAGEKETLGLYLTGHPVNRYLPELTSITSGRIGKLANGLPERVRKPETGRRGDGDKPVVLAGLVIALRVRNTQRGGKMAFLTLDDGSARMEIRVFTETYERFQAMLAKDKILVIDGTLGVDDYSGGYQVTAQTIYDINQAREMYARRLVVGIDSGSAANGFTRMLADVLTPFREGICPVWIDYTGTTAHAQVALGKDWRVHPTDELIHRLRELAGEGHVEIVYK